MPCSSSAGMYNNFDSDAHARINKLEEVLQSMNISASDAEKDVVKVILDSNTEVAHLKSCCDGLTYQNDLLREIVLNAYNDGKIDLDDELAHKINIDQMNHRQEDLDRLEKVFLESKDSEKLGKVWSADVQFPLEPQLGFDPNDY